MEQKSTIFGQKRKARPMTKDDMGKAPTADTNDTTDIVSSREEIRQRRVIRISGVKGATSSSKAKTAISFGGSKNPLSFGSTFGKPAATTGTSSTAPSFKLPGQDKPKATFSFGGTKGFSFTKKPEEPKPEEPKPEEPKAEEPKTGFSFGGTKGFSFKKKTEEPKPEEPKPEEPKPEEPKPEEPKPEEPKKTTGFSFAPPSGKPLSFNFSFNAGSANKWMAKPTEAKPKVHVELKPVAKPALPRQEQTETGEDDEETLVCAQKCKFYSLDLEEKPPKWVEQYQGELKINRPKEGSTCPPRLILRRDKTGLLSLNGTIFKNMPVSSPQPKYLRVIMVNSAMSRAVYKEGDEKEGDDEVKTLAARTYLLVFPKADEAVKVKEAIETIKAGLEK